MKTFSKKALLGVSAIALMSAISTGVSADDTDWSNPQHKSWRNFGENLPPQKRVHVQNLEKQFEHAAKKIEPAARKPFTQKQPASDIPLNAKPGECYAKVQIPVEYETISEQVMVSKGSVRYDTTPAEYTTEEIQVIAEEAKEELKVIPATYKTITEKVLVRPAYDKIVEVPATYKTVTEEVLVRPAYTTWKKGRGPIEKQDDLTGDIMCLVEVPAEYKTISTRVVDTPASTKRIPVQAEYKEITKTVVDQPARVEKVEIPAKYKTISVQKLARAAEQKAIKIDPVYETVTKRIPVGGGTLEWRSILCETNATPDVIKNVQKALQAAGFFKGSVSGSLDADTMAAVEAYQKQNNLPSGQLTIRTLKHLGVSPNTAG